MNNWSQDCLKCAKALWLLPIQRKVDFCQRWKHYVLQPILKTSLNITTRGHMRRRICNCIYYFFQVWILCGRRRFCATGKLSSCSELAWTTLNRLEPHRCLNEVCICPPMRAWGLCDYLQVRDQARWKQAC